MPLNTKWPYSSLSRNAKYPRLTPHRSAGSNCGNEVRSHKNLHKQVLNCIQLMAFTCLKNVWTDACFTANLWGKGHVCNRCRYSWSALPLCHIGFKAWFFLGAWNKQEGWPSKKMVRQTIVYLREKRQPIVSQPQNFADFAAQPLVGSLIVFLPKTNYFYYRCFLNSHYDG